jgi:hypothetical protein
MWIFCKKKKINSVCHILCTQLTCPWSSWPFSIILSYMHAWFS